MKFRKDGQTVLVRLDKGDEIVSCLEDVCSRLNIGGANAAGIGAAEYVAIRTHLPRKDIYREDVYKGVLEIVSLNGNISEKNGDGAKAHLHILFTYVDDEEKTHLAGGHLKEAVISYTAEIFITPCDVIRRTVDEDLNIEVWDI